MFVPKAFGLTIRVYALIFENEEFYIDKGFETIDLFGKRALRKSKYRLRHEK